MKSIKFSAVAVCAGLMGTYAASLTLAECDPGWLGEGTIPGLSSTASALEEWDDGSGVAVYAGGAFVVADGTTVNYVAKWDGTAWSALSGGTNGSVRSLCVFDDGNGPALYAGGQFTLAGGAPANCIAKWDGATWSALGEGTEGAYGGDVNAMIVYDDGTGPVLHVFGSFDTAGGAPAPAAAKWDGQEWSPLGEGLTGAGLCFADAAVLYDDGTGEKLYTGGTFTFAGGAPASRVAAWDGTSWSALGSGMYGAGFYYVSALGTFDDGTGMALYAGGKFTHAGGQAALNVAKWDGTDWSAVGAGLNQRSHDFAVYEDETGPALYAGGAFTMAGDTPANYVAKWDGTDWWPVAEGVSGESITYVKALLMTSGDSPDLMVGGLFTTAGEEQADHIAIWHCEPPPPLAGDCNCDGLTDFFDIDPFIMAVASPDVYATQYPDCDRMSADCNYDGSVDFFDIDPFILILSSGAK